MATTRLRIRKGYKVMRIERRSRRPAVALCGISYVRSRWNETWYYHGPISVSRTLEGAKEFLKYISSVRHGTYELWEVKWQPRRHNLPRYPEDRATWFCCPDYGQFVPEKEDWGRLKKWATGLADKVWLVKRIKVVKT